MKILKDKTICSNLDIIKKLINEMDYDWVHIICGGEGEGKSTLGIEMCSYVDPYFIRNMNLVSTLPQLKESYKKIGENNRIGSAINIDEGALLFLARNSMTTENKIACNMLRGLRGMNPFIVICMPDFVSLDPYIRDFRVKSVSRIVKRGWAWFYSKKRINQMMEKYKTSSKRKFRWIEPNFKHYFPDLPENLKIKYKELKKKQMLEYTKDKKDKETQQKEDTLKVLVEAIIKEYPHINPREISEKVFEKYKKRVKPSYAKQIKYGQV